MAYAGKNPKKLQWKEINCTGAGTRVRRAKVPGGWLVAIENTFGLGLTFYPDQDHLWNGKSLEGDF